MTDIEKEILRLQDPETMRLHMGELSPSELLVAQAAVRYALARARSERVVSVGELGALCDEWDSEAKDAAAPQPYREACRCFVDDLRALIAKAEVDHD